MYARPKPGETEEDLLRLQAEFERGKAENKIKIAATVVSTRTQGKNFEKLYDIQFNCFFIFEKEPQEHNNSLEASKADIEDQLANTFEAIPSDIEVKGIVEKHEKSDTISDLKFQKGVGFPKVKRRDVYA